MYNYKSELFSYHILGLFRKYQYFILFFKKEEGYVFQKNLKSITLFNYTLFYL
jgi:hypothetical protein